jgi:hypothetical protein
MSKLNLQIVVARLRAADHILQSPELSARFLALGGKKSDLQTIRDKGNEAEAQTLARRQAATAGISATADVLALFAEIQHEYVRIMSVLRLVLRELQDNGAPHEQVTALERIINNEVAVVVDTVQNEAGEKKRKVKPSTTQEAIRQEIVHDAKALIDRQDLHASLAERNVTVARLQKLANDGDSIKGKLADRAAAKGNASATTVMKSETVKAQSQWWKAAYGILADMGRSDPRIAALLSEAARPTAKTPKASKK